MKSICINIMIDNNKKRYNNISKVNEFSEKKVAKAIYFL